MQFEWDEQKRASNIAKHRLDFREACLIWLEPVIDPFKSGDLHGEERRIALGTIGDEKLIIAVIYTVRNRVRRIISARRARRYERKDYQNQFGRGR